MKENITWVTRGVLVTLSEQLDGDEFFQVNEKVYGDSRFDNLRYQLWDFTKVTEFNVNIEDMIKIAAHDKAAALSNSNMKIAIVATEEMAQTLLNLYQAEMFTSPWESEIFNSMDEAQQWVL
jgi:hypothetical protein